MRYVSAVAAALILGPTIYLGAWGASLSLDWKIGFNAIALAGTLAAIPMCRLADEELREGQAKRARRKALMAANYAASTQQGISQIQAAYGIGKPPQWQADLLRDMRQMQALMAQIEAMGTTGETAIGPESPSLPTYALSSLPSESKHLLLCGDTGAGKSTLVKAVVAMFPGTRVRVYDIDATDQDWAGYEVVGRGDDFTAIARAMAQDLEAFDDRAGLNTNAVTDIIIAEEYPAIAEEIPAAKDWLKKLARRGRKRGFRVVLVSQDIQVDSLGLRNQSKLLTNFNKLYLGGYAFDKLGEVRDRQERAAIGVALRQQQRPCLAEVGGRFFPCELPNLAGFRHEPANPPRTPANPPRTQPANPLEPLLSLGSGKTYFTAMNPEISPDERGFVVSLRRTGLTQDPIIKKVWGCSKGGGANYLAAREKYRQILADAGLM